MKSTLEKFEASLKKLPTIAILRGVGKDEVVEVAQAIYEAGISIIEVPLNTHNAFDCIEKLSTSMKDRCIVGCGTLVNPEDVSRLVDVGGALAVTPTTQPEIIEACLTAGVIPMPGWMTPTEAFSAVRAGANYLKLFPASTAGFGHIKAVKSVLPGHTQVFAVGGVKLADLELWKAAGASGFGFGSEIFTLGRTPEAVGKCADTVVAKVREVYEC